MTGAAWAMVLTRKHKGAHQCSAGCLLLPFYVICFNLSVHLYVSVVKGQLLMLVLPMLLVRISCPSFRCSCLCFASPCRSIGIQIFLPVASFLPWVLGLQTHALMPAREMLYLLNHLSKPPLSFFVQPPAHDLVLLTFQVPLFC